MESFMLPSNRKGAKRYTAMKLYPILEEYYLEGDDVRCQNRLGGVLSATQRQAGQVNSKDRRLFDYALSDLKRIKKVLFD